MSSDATICTPLQGRLQELLLEHELSIPELAAKADVPRETVWHVVSKGRRARMATMRKLAGALGTTVADLLGQDAA